MTTQPRLRRAITETALRVAARLSGTAYPRLRPGAAYVHLQVYSVPDAPRWGWGRPRHRALEASLAAQHAHFVDRLEMIPRYGRELHAIDREHRDDLEPCWENPLFIGLDGASLYGFLRDRRPQRYVEIGSGYSTKFAARAKRDGALSTEIVSIDPEPRADIDALCDRLIRATLEDADPRTFAELEEGDILLLDGSHFTLMGNDVVVFFTEILPAIPPGVLVGVHDVYLPDDYAPEHADLHWTEQYLLAAALLSPGTRLRAVLPCHYVASTSPLQERLDRLWEGIGQHGINAWAACSGSRCGRRTAPDPPSGSV